MYCPLCMLDNAGKLLKRIICNRLEARIENVGGLAEHQYDFRKTHSTVDAIKVVVDKALKALDGRRWKGGAKCSVIIVDDKNKPMAGHKILYDCFASVSVY